MNKLIELAKIQGIKIEICKDTSKTTEMNILNGAEKSFVIKNNATYIIKAIKNNKSAKLTTETLENPEKILENLRSILDIQDNDNKSQLCQGNIVKNRRKEDFDCQKVKEDLVSLINLKEDYPEIDTMEFTYKFHENNKMITNEQAYMENEYVYHELLISITMSKDSNRKNLYTYYFFKEYDFEDLKEYIKSSIKNLKMKLDFTSCKTGKYNIILKNETITTILAIFSDMFQAKSMDLKESILNEKLNQHVFHEKITIIEDPQNEKRPIQTYFDEEGTLSSYQELVKHGVFLKRINNTEYALKHKEKPTGNANGVTNLYIKPGNISYEELVQKLNTGMIIDKIEGTNAGINTKNGDISLQASGLIVKNGQVTKGLDQIILTTNLFELLNHVVEVANDMSCNKLNVSAPSLLLKEITIAGKE